MKLIQFIRSFEFTPSRIISKRTGEVIWFRGDKSIALTLRAFRSYYRRNWF